MSDIEKLLVSSGNIRPRRELGDEFTSNIINHIDAHPRKQGWRGKLTNFSTMKIFHKRAVAMALIPALLGIGGVAYAIANWPAISAVFSGETILSSGNKVIAVDTTNCQSLLNPDKKSAPTPTTYYEIKKESGLTAQQVVDMVRGMCENQQSSDMVNQAVHALQSQKGLKITSSGNMLITALTNKSISLKADDRGMEGLVHTTPNPITYKRLSPGLKVYGYNQTIPYSDLRVGDSVKVVVDDQHSTPSESDPSNPYHFDDPDMIVILAIVKIPAPTGNPGIFWKRFGKDFVRVIPCKTGDKGFCRTYDFD